MRKITNKYCTQDYRSTFNLLIIVMKLETRENIGPLKTLKVLKIKPLFSRRSEFTNGKMTHVLCLEKAAKGDV